MAENENINSTLELIDTEVYEQDIRVVDETDQVIVETEMQTIEVFEEDVSVVESDNAFSPIGEPNELLRHTLLTEREADDQHPITAITGLRAELDEIEKLKTVYSDKKNHANYYKWEDGNAAKEDRVGYFVSVCADEIKLCTLESDVFGVTVDSAGFVGSQSDIEKDEKYGLVASNGLVLVRCELSVDVGDYVISNDYGYAQKSDFGFVVVSRQKINGIEYAGIALTTPINRICKLSANIEGLDGRMSDAEKNIISAINASNAAYKKAEEASSVSQNANNNASNALDKVNGVVEKTDELESNISSAKELAVYARAVAELAAVSAETIRKEAVETANRALSDVSSAIKDLDVVVEEMQSEINDADSKAQLVVEDLTQLKEDMEPLAEWKDDNGNHSFAGFVAQADENSAILADLVQWQGAVEDGSVESIAGIEKRVSDNEATLSVVSDYKKENEDGTTTDGFAGLITQVDENKSDLSTLTSYKYEEDGKVVSSGLAGLIQQVSANASSIKMLAGFEDENVDSLGEIAIKVNVNESAITSLNSWRTNASATIASTEQIAKENQASITNLTNADTDLKTTMTKIKQQSDENGASIELLAASVDKYSVGEYSQSYGLTQEQANNILKDGMVYVPTKHSDTKKTHSETFSDTGETNDFTPGSYYIWNNGDWVEYGNSVAFFSEEPIPSNALQYWYVDSNEAPEGYEAHVLYKYDGKQWIKVNILDGNVSNRLTSMIRQTTNKIAIDVADAQGNISSHQQWLDANSANIQDVVAWKADVESDVSNIATIKQTADNAGASIAQVVQSIGKDGKVNAASIVTAINDGGSSVVIEADHINLNGYVTVGSLKGEGTTTINGANITTGFIQSNNYVSNTSGMKLDLENGTWDSAKFKINQIGQMIATGGSIGGWKIDANGIHSNTSSYKVDLWSPSEDASNTAQWIFMFTDNTGETPTYPFVVRKDGTLLAERANIGGWGINSGTSGLVKKNDDFEVHIKAPTKHGGYGNGAADFIVLADKTGDVVDYPFVVSSDGSLFATKANITGNVTAKSGKIGNWSIGSVGLYKHGPGYTPDPNTSESDKIYFGMSYEGSVYLLPEGGTNSGYMIGGHVTTADDLWVFAISNTFGITKKGSLYASDASFVGNDTSGVTLSRQNIAHSVRIQNRYYEDDTNKNGIGEATFLDPKGIGYQYRPQNSSRKTFKQMIEFGYNNTNGYYGVLGGTWYLTSAEGSKVTSDQTKKNSIAPQSEIYSQIFDKLNPVTFKYNHGTSNRTHMGLIAQEVEEAALSSGVDTKDFAVVCYDVDENGNKIDYGIRYTELISMSIYEIQKLKARVAELEAKLENKEN